MIGLVEQCLRDGDNAAWVELWEVFDDASAIDMRRILAEHGVSPEDADAVVAKCWGELAQDKKTLRSMLGKSLSELKEWLSMVPSSVRSSWSRPVAMLALRRTRDCGYL